MCIHVCNLCTHVKKLCVVYLKTGGQKLTYVCVMYVLCMSAKFHSGKHTVACKNCVKTNYQKFNNCPNCKSKVDFVYTVKLETVESVNKLKKQLQHYTDYGKTMEQCALMNCKHYSAFKFFCFVCFWTNSFMNIQG